MGTPTDLEARKFYRVAMQRLEEAELILGRLDKPMAATYLAGYAVECMLKAMILINTPKQDRTGTLRSLKKDLGHNLGSLKADLIRHKVNVPRAINRQLVLVATWSPEMRYEPGFGNRKEAERFLGAVKEIVTWADGSI